MELPKVVGDANFVKSCPQFFKVSVNVGVLPKSIGRPSTKPVEVPVIARKSA
jgi:hypothetical protein